MRVSFKPRPRIRLRSQYHTFTPFLVSDFLICERDSQMRSAVTLPFPSGSLKSSNEQPSPAKTPSISLDRVFLCRNIRKIGLDGLNRERAAIALAVEFIYAYEHHDCQGNYFRSSYAKCANIPMDSVKKSGFCIKTRLILIQAIGYTKRGFDCQPKQRMS